MSSPRLRAVIDWLTAGYPAGVPPKDYLPLLALLRRRLTEDEVREVAEAIAASEQPGADVGTDIGVHVVRITDAMPSDDDVARVEAQLVSAHGWPVEPA